MPDIPLLHPEKIHPYIAQLILHAIMLSPGDIASQTSYLTLVLLSPEYSTLTKAIDARFIKAAPGGVIAGMVFYNLLQLKLYQHLLPPKNKRQQEASISKAVFLVSRNLRDHPPPNRRGLPHNRDGVHNFWVKFAPAAHLWAAWHLVPDPQSVSEVAVRINNQRLLLMGDALLSAANAAGLEFEQEPWTLSPGYPGKPFRFDLPPPSSWALKTLKEYEA